MESYWLEGSLGNGHDIISFMIAIESVLKSDRPTVIFAQTDKNRMVAVTVNLYAE